MSTLPLYHRCFALCGLLAALCVAFWGCENNSETVSSDEDGGSIDFLVMPSAVQLGVDETLASFTVQGGDTPLVWTVSDPGLGTLTDTEGRIANYRRVGASEGVNEIRATDAIGRTASAVVVQDNAGNDGPLRVTPSRRTIREREGVVTLQAVGGIPPYSWSVIDGSLGSLSNTSQTFVNYRRNGEAAGVNVVELTDSRDTLATAVISQPEIPSP